MVESYGLCMGFADSQAWTARKNGGLGWSFGARNQCSCFHSHGFTFGCRIASSGEPLGAWIFTCLRRLSLCPMRTPRLVAS